jgi:hypothetical protein
MPVRTWRQWLSVALAGLGALILIEVGLGARGAKPHERPLYFVTLAVEWGFMRGSGWVGSCIGYCIYSLYLLGAWVGRLTGPVLGETLLPLVMILIFPLRMVNALLKEMFVAMGQDETNAQGLVFSLAALTSIGIGVILIVQAAQKACSRRARKSLEPQASSSSSPQPSQPSPSGQSASGKRGKRGSWS